MPPVVVLDACVLYPLPLRDTLLRLAHQNLYAVRWSRRILDEVAWNLINDRRATTQQAANLMDAMTRAFEDAEIPESEVAALNLRHFPAAACEPFGIDAVHTDAFLCDMYAEASARVRDALDRQAANLSRPPMTVDDVLDRIRASVPEFVGRVRAEP